MGDLLKIKLEVVKSAMRVVSLTQKDILVAIEGGSGESYAEFTKETGLEELKDLRGEKESELKELTSRKDAIVAELRSRRQLGEGGQGSGGQGVAGVGDPGVSNQGGFILFSLPDCRFLSCHTQAGTIRNSKCHYRLARFASFLVCRQVSWFLCVSLLPTPFRAPQIHGQTFFSSARRQAQFYHAARVSCHFCCMNLCTRCTPAEGSGAPL